MTSIRKLGAQFQWSNDKVYRFLDALEADNMIIRQPNTYYTLITIVNYDKYQTLFQNSEHHPNADRTVDSTPTDTQPESYNKEISKQLNNSDGPSISPYDDFPSF
ncbi:hypothetical protein HHO41_21465 [Bacillus sp. DNRA2]|uniref:hypothetical protein n=1 Tax=Bacillus sp. DNRA2 TaxID=2723053 RepID=UPI00145F1CFD|nr:hypothetical protein [Bacillus sp. DNRA2]NMD72794.1 hypothetical protein [Bacillus sp. DNRA2]